MSDLCCSWRQKIPSSHPKKNAHCYTRHSSKLGGIPKKILVIPPDITRLHSNAGELTQLLYELWDTANGTTFDILPAIGTHAPMTEAQIAEMYGDLPKATYHVHNWRTGLHHFGEVPSEFVQEVSGGKLDYSIPVAVNRHLVEGNPATNSSSLSDR